ncbi:uncharacterized protein EI97DRAFT_492946 [Westerdykella ornata]|uniref:C2H2-type domain-containing protein n=1 Tax=Westerdykella ornata TaxID=318751 RepID=A0A6A6JQX6_WESOR|nr:uncharacterized protein EI97DRAFT_492946 [Westerdykella ornata]KAF2278503.1 hypothetical protein EI97DRAFT_492946 [Westerdykella ornata]
MSDTATNPGANTDTHLHSQEQQHESHSTLVPSKRYLCTSCQVSFHDGQEQRVHMKEAWHVYNIKRRIASLPPIPRDIFETQIEKKAETNREPSPTPSSSDSSSDEEASQIEFSRLTSPYLCLFCSESFPTSSEGFSSNLSHMRTVHGLSIPNAGAVSDLQSLVEYLATEVRIWHECLYCGAVKGSAASVQSHMRDKNHCLLNLEREPELRDFWERSPGLSEGEEGSDDGKEEKGLKELDLDSTDGEIRLRDGRVIASRQAAPEIKKAVRKQRALAASAMQALPPGSEEQQGSSSTSSPSTQLTHLRTSRDLAQRLDVPPSPPPITLPSRQQLSRRDEMSITGLSPQQQRALVLAEKKAQRSEAMARRARDWAYAQGKNSQKFDQLDNGKGKWGKQNHKLMPR